MADMRAILDAIGALPDGDIDLADAALQLARIDAPDADFPAARAHLTALARDAAALGAQMEKQDLLARATALSRMFCDRYEYRGDIETYDDPANANLLRVIERRRGLPVSLGILWLHAATSAGWWAYGVDLPGHFVVALGETAPDPGQARRLVLDVFDGGRPLDERAIRRLVRRVLGNKIELDPQMLQPMSNRAVLLRLQGNIRIRRIQAGDLKGALACAEDMLRIAPDEPALWREAGNLQERLDHVAAALHSYERFLALAPPGPSTRHIRTAIDTLRTRLN
jgi:regulator of sirC expression with transglutaminase-like and TPR domain